MCAGLQKTNKKQSKTVERLQELIFYQVTSVWRILITITVDCNEKILGCIRNIFVLHIVWSEFFWKVSPRPFVLKHHNQQLMVVDFLAVCQETRR